MRMMKSALACLTLIVIPTSAMAGVSKDPPYTEQPFFQCWRVSGLWHVISTGNWIFHC